jgi:hypothetical protein
MKVKYLSSIIGMIIILFFGCSGDKESLDIEDYLVNETWIKYSYDSNITTGFEEYSFKNEYTFYDNGTFMEKVIYTIQVTEFPYFQTDTSEIYGGWHFDRVNNIIDFEINDTLSFYYLEYLDSGMIPNVIPVGYSVPDLKVINVKSQEFVVEHLYPKEYNSGYFDNNNGFKEKYIKK